MLEMKKLEAELAGVFAARLQLEVKIEERSLEIENMKKHIKIQEDKEEELKKQIAKMKEGK